MSRRFVLAWDDVPIHDDFEVSGRRCPHRDRWATTDG